MRYPPDQKAKAEVAILEAGARTLRKHGFNGVGVDGLASAAGVTSGALYSNFSGKEAILEKVIENCLGVPFVDEEGKFSERREKLREWLAIYISEEHRKDPEAGCVMPTLSADVARGGSRVRSIYGTRMKLLVDKITNVLNGKGAERERRAWSIVALMVGAITIARAMPDGKDERAAIHAALRTAQLLLD